MRFLKTHWIKILTLCFALSLLLTWWANRQIQLNAQDFLFENLSGTPPCKTGLLLGTSSHLANGEVNPYWLHRIEAAELLLKSGKIRHLVISGDNSVKEYDEPSEMRTALIERGIDSNLLSRDFAGFRTLDSVVRMKVIFRQDSFLIVSQQFHNERAIYLAQQNGLVAFGFNAADVPESFGFKTRCREYLARVKALFDALLHVEPKYDGEVIELPV